MFPNALVAFAVVSPGLSGSSSSGPLQCCGTLHKAGSAEVDNIVAGLVGLVVKSITSAQVGLHAPPSVSSALALALTGMSSHSLDEHNF